MFLRMGIAVVLALLSCTTTYGYDDEHRGGSERRGGSELNCQRPPYLRPGDKVALISPSYFTPTENVEKTAEVLRRRGLVPVIGPNVGKTFASKYAGTADERLGDLRWALRDPSVKAILCNRGGYGAIHFTDKLKARELAAAPKWVIGFSDITALLGMEACAGVAGIHGTMCSLIAPTEGRDTSTVLMLDMLMGRIPRYELPPHPQNLTGKAQGVLVGGNLCTFVPQLNTWADATAHDGIVLFIEEVGESMHNIDRLFNMLRLQGVLGRCRGVVLGEFTGCNNEFGTSVEAMLREYLKDYRIPVACGMPSGHGDVNLPLMMGARVTLDVRHDGATITFNEDGEQQTIRTEEIVNQAGE